MQSIIIYDINKFSHIYKFYNNNKLFKEIVLNHKNNFKDNIINDEFKIKTIDSSQIRVLIYLINNNNDNSTIELYGYNSIEIIYEDDVKTSKIDININDISTNESNIASNLEKVNTNESNIASNLKKISTNESDISSKLSEIGTNENNISCNLSKIGTNESDISSNLKNTSTNESDISSNLSKININTKAISSNLEKIDNIEEFLTSSEDLKKSL